MLRSLRREDGYSLPEIAVIMMLMTIAGGMFYTFLFSAQRSVTTQTQRSKNNEDARLAIERLDREIKSGNVLYDPQNEVPVEMRGYILRVYTQSRPGDPRCAQWRIHENRLERRTWTPNPDPDDPPPPWTTLAEGIVNKERSVPAFVLDPEASKSGRTVIVDIVTGSPAGEVARIRASITGRNTTFGFPVTACQTVPPL